MSATIPNPPLNTQFLDDRGFLTPPWQKWITLAFLRMGGTEALSNVELQELSSGAGVQAQITALQTNIDQNETESQESFDDLKQGPIL